ncbi:MAG: inositol monophosphatase [Parvibaculaceae bacterium]|nr:inositol monophosphatase [Parvibaculaceae bacterium]
MKEVAALEIMPRFRLLAEGDIKEKSKNDFVTIADRRAEEWLTPRLEALVPGSRVLGEEAVADDPARLDLVRDEDAVIWTVDPVDGTGNFVAGSETFGVMVALIRQGISVQGWIYLPVSKKLVTAERGGGCWLHQDGESRRLDSEGLSAPLDELRGSLNVNFMPPSWKERLLRFAEGVKRIPSENCSAFEYTLMAQGLKDFTTYYRMMPWDHAPGSLILEEAGGAIRSLETGLAYRPALLAMPYLLVRDAARWEEVAKAIKAR